MGRSLFYSTDPDGRYRIHGTGKKGIHPSYISIPTGVSKLKEVGFTKLVRRDEGVYENVTALDGEKRYMEAGDPSSIPHFYKKIQD